MSSKTFAQVIIGLFSILAVPSVAEAGSISCYTVKQGYRTCDLKQVSSNLYRLSWPNGATTGIANTSSRWVEVAHADSYGDIYWEGTRYKEIRYERGRWLCFKAGRNGGIDFCLRL